jgi:hypothetical protein
MTSMTNEAKRAVVEALIRLADCADYRDRVDAGRALASFVETPSAREPLQRLLLDAGDTAVTLATAQALLRREDSAGLAAVASAMAVADPNHEDWLCTAVHDVFDVYATQRDAAVHVCDAMAESPDETLRRGADRLRDILREITPVLWPVGEEHT